MSEATFLPTACAWLAGRPRPLSRVYPLPNGYTGQLTPAALTALYPARRPLDGPVRKALAEDFVRIRSETGLLRRWNGRKIVGVPQDRYDPISLGCVHSGLGPSPTARRRRHVRLRSCQPPE